MANIAISEITTEATSLNDDDLLLVSKKNGTSFTSAKMKAGVVTSSFSSDCQNVLNELNTISAAITSLSTKVDNIQTTQNTHTEYLANLTDLDTRIGNKIFSGTYGDDKTLTLNTSVPSSKCALSGTPTITPEGGTYASGTRVVITAPNPTDTLNYKFSGWYQGTALVSNQQSYSYEVTSNVTLTAKYSVINRYVTATITVTNNSNYTIGYYYSYGSGTWYDIISPNSSGVIKEYSKVIWNNESGWVDDDMQIYNVKGSDNKPISDITNIIGFSNNVNCKAEYGTGTEYKNSLFIGVTGTPIEDLGVLKLTGSITITNK